MNTGPGAILVLALALAFAIVFLPAVPLLESPPHVSLVTCSVAQSQAQCKMVADYYRGGGSLSYCLLGEGALYLRGVYYPLAQPVASPAREVSNVLCPALRG